MSKQRLSFQSLLRFGILKTGVIVFTASPLVAQSNEFLTMCGGGTGALPSPWQRNGQNISYSAGDVGINTTSPQADLDVNGTIRANNLTIGVGQNQSDLNLILSNAATACAGANQSIKTIASDGTVICETDDSAGAVADRDCYIALGYRFNSLIGKPGFYLKAIYKGVDNDWDWHHAMFCRADSSIDDPNLPTAEQLRTTCTTWAPGGTRCDAIRADGTYFLGTYPAGITYP